MSSNFWKILSLFCLCTIFLMSLSTFLSRKHSIKHQFLSRVQAFRVAAKTLQNPESQEVDSSQTRTGEADPPSGTAVQKPVGAMQKPWYMDYELPVEAKVAHKKHPNGALTFLRQNGLSIDLAKANVDAMTNEQLRLTLHSVLDNTDTICSRKLRMGHVGDGGWEICDDPDVAPVQPCLIYSFGINNDFSFDDDSARIYGCHVFSFDPSMKRDNYNRSKLVHFYKEGIYGETVVNKAGWKLFTLNDLKVKHGHRNQKLAVVKMDVEASEWSALPEMLSTGALDDVKQLLIEFHVKAIDRETLLPRVKALQGLELLGFRKFYVSKNYHCAINIPNFPIKRTRCYEVHYIKRTS